MNISTDISRFSVNFQNYQINLYKNQEMNPSSRPAETLKKEEEENSSKVWERKEQEILTANRHSNQYSSFSTSRLQLAIRSTYRCNR